MKRLRRNSKGNQISEFGPAVFILIVCIFVPMLVLIYVGFGFCCGWYLNFMTVRSCALAKDSAAAIQQACQNQEAAWYSSGLPAFAGATVVRNGQPPDGNGYDPNAIRVSTDVDAPVDFDDYCRIVTVVEIKPFISIPFVPLGPWTFTYFGERPIEEPDLEGVQIN